MPNKAHTILCRRDPETDRWYRVYRREYGRKLHDARRYGEPESKHRLREMVVYEDSHWRSPRVGEWCETFLTDDNRLAAVTPRTGGFAGGPR